MVVVDVVVVAGGSVVVVVVVAGGSVVVVVVVAGGSVVVVVVGGTPVTLKKPSEESVAKLLPTLANKSIPPKDSGTVQAIVPSVTSTPVATTVLTPPKIKFGAKESPGVKPRRIGNGQRPLPPGVKTSKG